MSLLCIRRGLLALEEGRRTLFIRFSISSFAYLFAVFSVLAPHFAAGQTTNLLSNPGFEQNTTGWFGFGPVSFTTTTTLAHSGARSAFIQNRTDTWNGVAQSLAGVLQPNISYQVSAWVRLSNS